MFETVLRQVFKVLWAITWGKKINTHNQYNGDMYKNRKSWHNVWSLLEMIILRLVIHVIIVYVRTKGFLQNIRNINILLSTF